MNLGSIGSALGLSGLGPIAAGTGLAMGDSILQGAFSAQQAARQMQFQREMSDTAFQRRASDLAAAGLNPILAATGGPASVGSGAMGGASSNMVSSALAASQQKINQELADSQVKLQDSQAFLNSAQWNLVQTQDRYQNASANIAERQDRFYRENPGAFWIKELAAPVSSAVGAATNLGRGLR